MRTPAPWKADYDLADPLERAQAIRREIPLRMKRAEREGKVVAFLRANPLSTAAEVFAATGCGVIGLKFVTWTRYEGEVRWRLNHRKLREAGLEK